MNQVTVPTARKLAPAKNKAAPVKPLMSLVRRVEDFLIPPLCIVCDEPLAHAAGGKTALRQDADLSAGGNLSLQNASRPESDRWFCAACLDDLIRNYAMREACPRCAVNRRKRECACEFAWDFPFEKIYSVYDYDETLSVIAKHIKYKGKSQLASHIGTICAVFIPHGFWSGADIVIPVPLHKSRMRTRGYNQAEHFAKGVLKGLESKLPPHHGPQNNDEYRHLSVRTDILTRTRNTGTQTKLDREGRLENLAGAFAVNPRRAGLIKGKNVVLVDDILTTGATTEACTDELLRAGCASVRVLSLGRD